MVKHTQTNFREEPTNSLSVFDQFVGLAIKGLSFWIFLGEKCLYSGNYVTHYFEYCY